MKRIPVFVAIVLVLTLALGCSSKSSPVPPEVAQNIKDWPTANKDYENTRATTDSTIKSGNVNTLGVAWTFDIPGIGEYGAAPTNPLIAGDIVYLQDMKSNVFAVDLKTGRELWRKMYNTDVYGPEGPAIGWGKIFVMKGHYDIAALDITNGNELWSTKLSDKEIVGIDIQLTAYGNMVYVSTVPGSSNADFYSGGQAGVIYALDQQSGAVKWSWNTVDSADIWGNPAVNSGGGAWYPPAIDTDTGIIYWGIGNPAPWPGTKDFPNGSSRPGLNLYTNSMVALDAKTGKLLWYNQVLPHDLFDLDFQNSPILTSATINGARKDIVIGSGKLGTVYAFDRKTGEIYWQSPVGLHQNDNLKELPAGTTRVLPGVLGGIETPMAIADGVVYAPIVDMFSDFMPTGLVAGTLDFGAATGELTALDVNNGHPLWNVKFDSMAVGSATAVNDVVFTATLGGMIYGLNARTGQKLWTYQASGGINGGPAVTRDLIIFPVGMGARPQLVAFQLGKPVSSPTPSATSPATTSPPPPASTPASSPVPFKADGVISNGEYTHQQTYSAGAVELQWKNDDSYIYLAIKAKTTGWASVAIQPGSTMMNSDMIFGYVANGKTSVFDLFSTGSFGPHPEDTALGGTNDILESGGKEENGYTVIEFKRALKTSDKYDNALTKGSNQIIWAYGAADSVDVQHSARGYGEVTID
jgi:outer membrane protein assembly factor BamB